MRIIEGIVKKLSTQNTVLVEIERLVPHNVYGKILRRTTTLKVDSQGEDLKAGDKIKIVETRPISKNKNFKVYQKSKKGKPSLAKAKEGEKK